MLHHWAEAQQGFASFVWMVIPFGFLALLPTVASVV